MIKVFIVDDDQSLQRLYGLILKEAGFEIIGTAINGKDAIEKYTNLEGRPDLVLMDHRMPIKNGLDAMVEILTSADMSVKQKAISLGAVAFLDKPFKMQHLLITIRKIVKELIIER